MKEIKDKPLTTGMATLPPQQQKVLARWQSLIAQAQRINQLAAELEVQMLEFKAIANTVNSQRSNHPHSQKVKSVCEYLTIGVPYVGQLQDGSLILATRTVDLFRAEREATQVAQALRHRAKRKKVALQPGRNKGRRGVNR